MAASIDPFLKAKFQIGSAAGRLDYEQGEHVFHTDDVPQKAKNARREVAAVLKSHKLVKSFGPFDNSTHTGATYSGQMTAPWDGNTFEDRIAHKQDAAKRNADVASARHRQIHNIEVDPRRFQPSWAASTFVEHGKLHTELPGWIRPSSRQQAAATRGTRCRHMSTFTGETKFGTSPPKITSLAAQEAPGQSRRRIASRVMAGNRQSLYSQELEHERKWRDKKRVEREKRKQDSAYAEVVRGLHGSDHTFPANNTLPRLRSEDTKKSLNQTLESTYTAEALQDYLATMVAVPQAVGAGPSFRRTQRQIRRVQAQGRGEEPGPQVVKEYEHRGKWAFSAVEDCDAWSCCMNPQQDSRGCSSRVVVDQRRWNTSS